ncbi:hypothetical protein pb186bvf_002112 [Paramecium bursaria]
MHDILIYKIQYSKFFSNEFYKTLKKESLELSSKLYSNIHPVKRNIIFYFQINYEILQIGLNQIFYIMSFQILIILQDQSSDINQQVFLLRYFYRISDIKSNLKKFTLLYFFNG